MLESDWLDLDHETLTVEPCTGQDDYGAPIYGAAVTAPAIVQAARKLRPLPDGRVEVSTTQLFVLSTSLHVGAQDRLSWTHMAPPTTDPPRILGVDHVGDEDGQHHVEIDLG